MPDVFEFEPMTTPLDYDLLSTHPGRFKVQQLTDGLVIELVPRSAKRQIPLILALLFGVIAVLIWVTHERMHPSGMFRPSLRAVVMLWMTAPVAALMLPWLITMSDRQQLTLRADATGLTMTRMMMGMPDRQHFALEKIRALGVDPNEPGGILVDTAISPFNILVARKPQYVREMASLLGAELQKHRPDLPVLLLPK